MKKATLLTTILLVVIAVLHLVRLIGGVQVTVDDVAIPMWASVVATIVPLALAFGIWQEHRVLGADSG